MLRERALDRFAPTFCPPLPGSRISADRNGRAGAGALNRLEFFVAGADLSLLLERQVKNSSNMPKADDHEARELKRMRGLNFVNVQLSLEHKCASQHSTLDSTCHVG